MDLKEFDVFVIGSGVAGRLVARSCAKNNLKVAITDNREFGGTCANRGCDPKKVILGPSELIELSNKLSGKGICSQPKLDWKALQKFKKTFTKHIPEAVEHKLADLGITLFHQSPRFISETTLRVEGKIITAKKIVIATGLIPRNLNFNGSKLLKTSDDFLDMKTLPKSMIFLGSGYIGMEFAHMAARFGVKVTILDHGSNPLKTFDPDLVSELIETSKSLGIKFIFNATISKIEKLRKNTRIIYNKNGKTKHIKARVIFNTTGRVPALKNLDLEKGNVSYSKNGVLCNLFMQNTTNPNVYACGDVSAHSVPLSPLSGIEAKIVTHNILNGNTKKIEIPSVPSVIFTLPNLASVGLLENEAKKRYKNVRINYASATHWYNAKRTNVKTYSYKIIINDRTDQIVGAHILGPYSAETINLFTIAIHNNITTKLLKRTIFTYPSWSNDIKSML